ncbi:MAG: sodium:alanine symporter family protein [Desulfovibrionaceae bacterium]
MEALTQIVTDINSFLWGIYFLIPLLCGTGIYFTFKLRFVQVRKFVLAGKILCGGATLFGKKADAASGMSSFQALATAIAAQVGTGNVAGTATALVMGGPGALFWTVVAAFFGMATIFAEAVLAQKFKTKDDSGHVIGGPAYYIMNGLGSKKLAMFFSVSIIIALGFIGNMVQANSIADAFHTAFGVNKMLVGIVVAFLAGLIFFGGIGRIASVTEKMVPVMAGLYLLGGFSVLFMYYDMLIPALKMIVVGAFDPQAVIGGTAGVTIKEAMRYGVARGLFSNEAGMGSTPHAHAVAKVLHPAQQGLVAMFGVFTTVMIVSITALVILVTGVADGSTTGITLTQNAYKVGLGSMGLTFVAVCIFFFAFSTIVGWYFFAEQNVKFLFGHKGITPYRGVVLLFLVLGYTLNVNLVWQLADMFNGFMVLPNLIALVALSKIVASVLEDFDEKTRVFKSDQVDTQ